MSNFNNYKKFENVGTRSSNETLIIMNSSNNNISLHSSDGGDDNVDTLSIKNIINKTPNEDLNLSSLTGTTINPVITINNNHSDCRIKTNLNVNGNVNINNNLIIPTHDKNSNLLSNIQGSIYYNTTENTYEGYSNEGWVSFSGFSKTKDAIIYKNLNVIGNINLTNGEMIQTSGIGSFGSINSGVGTFKNLNISGNLNLPVGITSSRPSNPSLGTIRYNSETHKFEGYTDKWINFISNLFLYNFTSNIFTNCGATGRTGPTLDQMRSAYSGTMWVSNTLYFNSNYQGYQLWTVPQTGNYRIKAYGAGGGWRRDNSHSYKRGPGLGAVTQGNFSLNQGEKLLIIVGQHSPTTTSGSVYAGGGGGATWVLRGDQWEAIDSNLYCVAGGGGGETSHPTQQADGQITVEHAGITQNPVVTNWSSVQSISNGYGGYYGGGGGSYGIKGGQGTNTSHATGGGAPYDTTLAIGGLSGSAVANGSNDGGFGGGGGSVWKEGGGGGGYIGGDTGSFNYLGGHGGSSRNNGTSILFANHSMHNGAVEITFIPEISIPITPLYNFTSPQTFGNYGALGQDGPTLAMATGGSGLVGADEWKNNLAYFNVINGIQYWTVPENGNYRIFAYGADALARSGGKGAIIGGTFTLERDEIIRILVGQRPEPYNTSNGGGGGGTFVVRAPYNTDSSILVIAGGGGGQHSLPGWSDNLNRHGQAPRVGGEGGMGTETSNDIYGKMGGTKGSEGEIGSDHNAGAGFYGSVSDTTGAKAFTDTNTPGRGGNTSGNEGGFGGGGRHGSSHGGGGGGYSGGAGSYGYPYQGGGGGSYNNGFNQAVYVGQDGWNNQGKVEITFIEENSYFYNFTSPQTFGNYGKVGNTGPTLSMATGGSGLVGANDWKNNLTIFNVINGIQYWTVPRSGNYTIKAYGADAEGLLGGRGAIITGTFTLTVGEIIRILVGQRPEPYQGTNGGGGGGTFVVRAPYNTDSSILVIAGGGGGAQNNTASRVDLNIHGQAGSNGGSGTGSGSEAAAPLYNIPGGTNGSAGSDGYTHNAGAGFYGSVSYGARAFTSPWDPSTPGLGGITGSAQGGFGCGGRHGQNHGGGGGGYSGGGGSGNYLPYQGGGGGSYNNGLNKIAEVGKDNGWLGHGKVEITFMPELPIAPTPLYNFTSQTFGNYGAVGKKGPTLIMATGVNGLVGADDWKNNLAYFNVANGIQYWTVPKSGNYTIKAYGADARVRGGGWGAIVTGNFSLVRGEIIRILVGQRPEPYTVTNGGGGAGGTFVVRAPYNTDDSILVIAGGAGGGNGSLTHPSPSLLQNANGQIVTSGGNGTDSTSTTPSFGVPGGTNGYGGQVQEANWGNRSGSGAGFYGNGMVPFTTYEIAQAFVSVTPGLGAEKTSGVVTTNFGEGGFGGGARIGQTNGGGGGGYSGGGGASNDWNGYGPWTAGGGGSYNNDSNGTAETGENNGWVGQGKVEITFIS